MIFEMKLPSSTVKSLVLGKLYLSTDKENIKFQATSGIGGFQHKGAWNTPRKGMIPPRDDYFVSTNRLWLPQVKGVEGSFYPITPFSVKTDNGTTRGDFGIHFDANVPGTAGCIALPLQSHWDIFREEMKKYNDKRIKQIPLIVRYVLS